MSGSVATADDSSTEIDRQRIMQMIPHRDPFLMIDKVVDVVANERAVGVKNVSLDEYYFRGHFPTRPVMPGVLIIEAMAQTAAVLVVHTLGPAWEGKLVYFASIDEARFVNPVFPGAELRIQVRKIFDKMSIWKFSGEAKVDGKLAAKAVFAAKILDN
jgi:3-hydroxyacyl-[acyl-carrier-protein] dehydratase